MTGWVVDASVFGSRFFSDGLEVSLPGLEEQVASGRCIVPQHWHLEVTNQILTGLRRKRTDATLAARSISLIGAFPLIIDPETARQAPAIYALARKHHLTSYDAAYLELAIRSCLPLASFDAALCKAARAETVAVVIGP